MRKDLVSETSFSRRHITPVSSSGHPSEGVVSGLRRTVGDTVEWLVHSLGGTFVQDVGISSYTY